MGVHLNLERAKHFGRQFISDNQRFTAEMLRPYEYICKNGMLPKVVKNLDSGPPYLTLNLQSSPPPSPSPTCFGFDRRADRNCRH